jgi:hypothetical protein
MGTSAGIIDGWAKYFNQVAKVTDPMATRYPIREI